jgi:hypothetical protein
MAEAKREYARITTEAAAGTLVKRAKVTVGAFLMEWLDSRRVRPNTLDGYRAALKPVIDHLGTVPLQHLDTPHLDELVTLRLTGEPILGRAWARECPNEADGGQPVVLHPPAGDRRAATGGTGDRRRARRTL